MVDLEEAVGTVLAHDLTEIRPGEFKGAAFKKGHVVREQDLQHLARIGKQRLYVLEMPENMMHEDDAALMLAESLAGEGVVFNTNPSEGKINLTAAHDGLLKVDVSALTAINMVDGIMCASRHTNTLVRRGELLAGTRAIPLVIERKLVEAAVQAAGEGGVIAVKEWKALRTGILITGNEVYNGTIEDRFGPIITAKLNAFGCPIMDPVFAPDNIDTIADALRSLIDRGAELLITTGGMSVDPDDVTRLGVLKAGGQDILYGASVLPGAMLLLAKIGQIPVIGVPACGMFHDQTIFDLVLPRILAGETLSRRDIASLGHGGLCLNCPECRFPCCPFGKAA